MPTLPLLSRSQRQGVTPKVTLSKRPESCPPGPPGFVENQQAESADDVAVRPQALKSDVITAVGRSIRSADLCQNRNCPDLHAP